MHATLARSIGYAAISPTAIALVWFYLLIVVTRIRIGFWPYYHYPDAGVWSAAPYPVAHVIAFALLAFALVSGPVGVVAAIVAKTKRKERLMRYGLMSMATCCIGVVIVRLDPGGFFNWFFD